MATTTFYTKQRCNWIEGRDAKVDEVMREWMHKFCTLQDVKICVSTFNVNGKSPQSVFPTWFSQKKEDIAEFYAVGLQEMDLSVGTYIIDNTKKMEGWVDAIHCSLPGGRTHFNVVGSMRLVGIFVIVFQASHSKVRVSDVNVKYVATGISVLVNKLGNKGGTAISMKMNDTWVCFVNAHFAAGNNELERRNQDFRDIYNDVVFYPRSQQDGLRDRPLEVPVMCLYDHDVVFWFGDLNYRLNTDIYGISNDEVRRIASSEKFGDLFQYCQLQEQMARGTVFKDFQEPKVLPFRPTYKYDCGTNTWDTSEKGRVPAWTDRILTYKKYPQVGLELIRPMESVETITISDHKPVRALFNLKVKKINESGANSVYEEAIRESDRRANEELPQVQLSLNEVDFGIVNYLEPKTRSVIVQNVGKSKVRFSFKVRPNAQNNQEICEKWLMVTPTHYQIPQGSSMEISLTVSISTDIVRRIQDILRNGQLQEILVLHLENGRDYFIPVTAVYNNSCFGSTLEKLLSARPKKEVNLIDFDDLESSLSDNCPPNVPRVIYRLVMALRARGAVQLNIEEEQDNEVFNRIRQALETGHPDDMSQIASSYMLYSALIRLLDSLDEPIILEGMFKIIHKEMIRYRTDARQLWTVVRSSLPKPNQAVLELICLMLREFFSQKYELRDQLSLWGTVLFRHDITEEKTHGMFATVLQTMCDYAADVALG